MPGIAAAGRTAAAAAADAVRFQARWENASAADGTVTPESGGIIPADKAISKEILLSGKRHNKLFAVRRRKN